MGAGLALLVAIVVAIDAIMFFSCFDSLYVLKHWGIQIGSRLVLVTSGCRIILIIIQVNNRINLQVSLHIFLLEFSSIIDYNGTGRLFLARISPMLK